MRKKVSLVMVIAIVAGCILLRYFATKGPWILNETVCTPSSMSAAGVRVVLKKDGGQGWILEANAVSGPFASQFESMSIIVTTASVTRLNIIDLKRNLGPSSIVRSFTTQEHFGQVYLANQEFGNSILSVKYRLKYRFWAPPQWSEYLMPLGEIRTGSGR